MVEMEPMFLFRACPVHDGDGEGDRNCGFRNEVGASDDTEEEEWWPLPVRNKADSCIDELTNISGGGVRSSTMSKRSVKRDVRMVLL